MAENERKKVDFTVFSWAIGLIFLILALVGGTVSALSSKVEKVDEANTTLGKDVSSIKADVSNIKENVNYLRNINANQSKNSQQN